MILEARAITVRYRPGAPRALDRVDCQVASAELVAVVGPNGSGKTTLVRALLGLLPLEQGSVEVDGRPVASWPRAELARIVGVVGQQEEVVFRLSVAETVMLGRYARLGPRPPRRSWTGTQYMRPLSAATSWTWRNVRSIRCRAASGSGYASPAPWRRSLVPWCSTSQPPRSMCDTRWSCLS